MTKTRSTKLSVALLVAACAVAPIALAGEGKSASESKSSSEGGHHGSRQPRAHTKEAFLYSYDTDGDGVVGKEEFLAARAISHKEKDLDGDGVVTKDEYVAEWEKRLEQQLAEQRVASMRQARVRYNALDKDEDNDMTLEEFNASGERSFSLYDTDGDGVVSESEAKPQERFGDVEETAAR